MLCSKCRTDYPRTAKYFALDKKRKDGLSSQCRKCRSKGSMQCHKQNPIKYYRYHRQFYQRHKQSEYARTKRYFITFSGYCVKLIAQIKQRCYNKNNPRYADYGGRGIKLCFTRLELQAWLKLHKIEPRGLDIHRIDNNGDYRLDNIEFMTKSKHTILHNTKGR